MARSHGTAGGSVVGGTKGEIGAVAERGTGRLLKKAPTGVQVLHDLTIPGSRANIDHAVITGTTVLLIDTKAWQPGWYITLFGTTWRKWKPWKDAKGKNPADKLTMQLAAERIGPKLPANTQLRSVIVVHSSKKSGTCRISLYRPKAAKAWTPAKLERWVSGLSEPADPAITQALLRFVKQRAGTSAVGPDPQQRRIPGC